MFNELKSQIAEIDIINAGNIIDDLKRTQNINLTIDEFLSKVSDMNNPNISNVNEAIENKLIEKGLIAKEKVAVENRQQKSTNIFTSLNIPLVNVNIEPTDLERNKFMLDSFIEINKLLSELCRQLEEDNKNFQIQIEKVDGRTVVYDFYNNGNQVRILKLFFGSFFGGKDNKIGISCDYSYGNNNSFNELITSKFQNGKLHLDAMMSMPFNKRELTIEDAVKEIWMKFIQPYLSK